MADNPPDAGGKPAATAAAEAPADQSPNTAVDEPVHGNLAPEGDVQLAGVGAMPPMPFHIKPGQPVPQYMPMGVPPMGMPPHMMPPGMQQMIPPGMQMPPQGLYYPPPDGRGMPGGKGGPPMQFPPPWAMGGPGAHGHPHGHPHGHGHNPGYGGRGRGGGMGRRGRSGRGGGGSGMDNGDGQGGRRRDTGALSKTNIYISGLKPTTTDEDLRALCSSYGTIVSAKAIIDRDLQQCKGYGFVMFEKEGSAKAAVDALLHDGAQAAFAKVTKAQVEWQGRQEADPTNLYLTNLPKDQDESALSAMLLQCLDTVKGEIVSCRVLRDAQGVSRGVGLARMDAREACEEIIKRLDGCVLPGCVDPLRVKFANSPSPRKFKFLQRNGGGRMQPGGPGGMPMYDPAVAEMGGYPPPGAALGLPMELQGMHIDPAMMAAQRTQAMMMAQVQPGQTPWMDGNGNGGGGGGGGNAMHGGQSFDQDQQDPATAGDSGRDDSSSATPAEAADFAAVTANGGGKGGKSKGGNGSKGGNDDDGAAASSAQQQAIRNAQGRFQVGQQGAGNQTTAMATQYAQYLQNAESQQYPVAAAQPEAN